MAENDEYSRYFSLLLAESESHRTLVEVYEEEDYQHLFLPEKGRIPTGGTFFFCKHQRVQARVIFPDDAQFPRPKIAIQFLTDIIKYTVN